MINCRLFPLRSVSLLALQLFQGLAVGFGPEQNALDGRWLVEQRASGLVNGDHFPFRLPDSGEGLFSQFLAPSLYRVARTTVCVADQRERLLRRNAHLTKHRNIGDSLQLKPSNLGGAATTPLCPRRREEWWGLSVIKSIQPFQGGTQQTFQFNRVSRRLSELQAKQ